MDYFLDTEFQSLPSIEACKLISIGLVREDGKELHIINTDFNWLEANEWLKQNVLPKLYLMPATVELPRTAIKDYILKWLENDPSPRFIGMYADYDWFVFMNQFGELMEQPEQFPFCCYDIKQLADDIAEAQGLQTGKGKGLVIPIDQDPKFEHNALYDARWTRDAYYWLKSYQSGKFSGIG